MKAFRIIVIAAILLLTGMAFTPCFSQPKDDVVFEDTGNKTEVVATDEAEEVTPAMSEDEIVTVDEPVKKKKKDKDVVELNQDFFINLGIDIATILLIVFLIYYPANKKLDYIFTFILFNIVIFLLTYVLNEVKISMGAAFGLFAVFSMLRYRTAGISMKDMTYLFIFIAIGLISAIQLEYYELAIVNGVLIVATFILDGKFLLKHETSQKINYDNMDLIHTDKRKELIEDLEKRTGLKIIRVSVGKINMLKDSAVVTVYYYE